MPAAIALTTLRHAQAQDLPFLFTLYADVRGPEMSAWGLPADQCDALMRMQFDAQRRSYAAAYPDAFHHIVLHAGQPIGRRLAARTTQGMHLVDIALLASHRNRGFGSQLIAGLMDDCRATAAPLSLQVFRGNPAIRLYRRLGFYEVAADQMYIQMEWTPECAPCV